MAQAKRNALPGLESAAPPGHGKPLLHSPHLSGIARFNRPDSDLTVAELIWNHVLAIGYSPAYLNENTDGLRQDWPRIPS